RDRPGRARAAPGVPAVQAQRRRARQPRAAAARARDRALRGRSGLAGAGLGPGGRAPLHPGGAGRTHPPARRGAARACVSPVGIEPLGEDALLLRLGRRIDPELNARVHALARQLEAVRPPWLLELVPAYASLALCVDTRVLDLDAAAAAVRTLLAGADAAPPAPAATVEIPVCHAPAFAPDLDALAARAGLDRDQAIALHCAGEYRVAMTGFAPGFPYLLGLDPRLAAPRLSSPRPPVPARSVAIGGAPPG